MINLTIFKRKYKIFEIFKNIHLYLNLNVLPISMFGNKNMLKVQKVATENGPTIHDVTSVKYNKENKIFSH